MKRSCLELPLIIALFVISSLLAATWIRTLLVEDVFRIRIADRYYYLNTCPNAALQFGTFPSREHDPKLPLYDAVTPDQFRGVWGSYVASSRRYLHVAGFSYLSGVPWIPSYWTVCAPIWFLLLGTGAPGWMLLRARRKWITPPPGSVCVKCGYDLRATPKRCPECGKLVGADDAT